ncbi:hypothetical protein CEXT_324781 [Caerostris extrusa]|uniref:Ig-like domain-containing protein n=1 Tax=Caerostris extrusa TaxID=172846 RepID=A0AAV4WHD4_CAEEX|nr:hypothetical protein CEXT_324781 [Caerostris extrusa]
MQKSCDKRYIPFNTIFNLPGHRSLRGHERRESQDIWPLDMPFILHPVTHPAPESVPRGAKRRGQLNERWTYSVQRNLGVPVILECTAEGEPPPEITWWQNGVPVSDYGGKWFISVQVVMVVNGLSVFRWL